jgi:hypothetical protein
MENYNDQILADIRVIYVACPACIYLEDEQYTCTVCECQGGNGEIQVLGFLEKHFNNINL